MPLTERQLLINAQRNTIKQFKLAKTESSLSLYQLSNWPNRLFSRQKIKYQKNIIPLAQNNYLALLDKNKNSDGFLWVTEAKNIEKAVYHGLIKPEALSSKILSTLGECRHVVLTRAHHHHTVSLKVNFPSFVFNHN